MTIATITCEDAFLEAFGRIDLAEEPSEVRFRTNVGVFLDGRQIATIIPNRNMPGPGSYAYVGDKAVGPALDPEKMRKRILSAFFGGDSSAMARAELRPVRA